MSKEELERIDEILVHVRSIDAQMTWIIRSEAKELEKQASLLKELDKKLSDTEKRIAELKEPNLQFESAKRQLERLRQREQVETEIKPLEEDLKKANLSLEEALSKLGYEPENPEKELKELRQKKQEYDQNLPIAELKPRLEADIKTAQNNLKDQQKLVSQTTQEIQELDYSETEHEKKMKCLKAKLA